MATIRTAYRVFAPLLIAASLLTAAPAIAETPRDLLTQAAFNDRDKGTALARIDRAQAAATAALQRQPDDQEAAIIQATARGYRAKLTGNRGDAIAARKQFEVLVEKFPHNPEPQVALGAWHVGVIMKLGRFMGRAAAGAQKPVGLAALDRSVALSNNRAMFLGLAGLLRLEMDPTDARGKTLCEAASRAAAPTPLDAILRKAATAVLVPLRKGDTKATQQLADRLLPFGMID